MCLFLYRDEFSFHWVSNSWHLWDITRNYTQRITEARNVQPPIRVLFLQHRNNTSILITRTLSTVPQFPLHLQRIKATKVYPKKGARLVLSILRRNARNTFRRGCFFAFAFVTYTVLTALFSIDVKDHFALWIQQKGW